MCTGERNTISSGVWLLDSSATALRAARAGEVPGVATHSVSSSTLDLRRGLARCLRSIAPIFLVVACDDTRADRRLPPGATLGEPVARVATDPVATGGDSADDPAIWVHPQYASQSLVFGTNKLGGLEWYGLDGKRLGIVASGAHPNNVDVAYGIRLGERTVDVVGASVAGSRPGFQLFVIDAEARSTKAATDAPFAVLAGSEPYGAALYRRARDGALFALVNDRDGRVEQYAIDGSSGTFTAALMRTFEVGGKTEGLVVDEERGLLFVAEEARAVWRYDAEPDAAATPRERVAVLEVGTPGVVPDIEGLAIYYGRGGRGFLLVSIQGSNRVFVLDREAPHVVRKVIDARASSMIGDLEDTDGIAVESFGLGAPFERGLFVAQDGQNPPHNQCFKFYAWPDIAGVDLLVDARRNPREPHWMR